MANYSANGYPDVLPPYNLAVSDALSNTLESIVLPIEELFDDTDTIRLIKVFPMGTNQFIACAFYTSP